MTNKFTEEQYQRIVEIYEHQDGYDTGVLSILKYIDTLEWCGYEEAIALANPLTREWAHDKFVEKEKKYYWTKNTKHKKIRLYKNVVTGVIAIYVIGIEVEGGEDEKLTESEIREWGFNPEMFEREEV